MFCFWFCLFLCFVFFSSLVKSRSIDLKIWNFYHLVLYIRDNDQLSFHNIHEHFCSVSHFLTEVFYTGYIIILSKCKQEENQVNELNPGQHLFEWKFSFKKECVYELFNQKRVDIAFTKSVIIHLKVFFHSKSCCPAFKRVEICSFIFREYVDKVTILYQFHCKGPFCDPHSLIPTIYISIF